jgi:hypothetical protein
MAVTKALESLQEKGFVRKTLTAGSRVTKYLHTVLDRFDLSRQETAILCELMLRGPQTVGQIRIHAERMSPFESLEEVEKNLRGLMDHDPLLALKLPREPGRKECRYTHLFLSSAGTLKTLSDSLPEPELAAERIAGLEEEISRLRIELEELKQAFTQLRSQF